MKNLKKLTRENLKQVQGGTTIPHCPPRMIYRCEAVGVCAPEFDQYDCVCGCIYP
ncbi:bacteriocin-like protein [Chryseobacterium sp. MIQD13]|uniref:bacteriocin-like protein n=1 Tax=Chryseobacterium sp. MIQD13 TaxID=3422310 RepID=UPI003D29E826